MFQTVSNSEEETETLGFKLGILMADGGFVALYGDLGAGKTAFTRGMAKAFNKDNDVCSPTFTLMQQYDGKTPVYHFDAYRLKDAQEAFEMGFDEYFDCKDALCIVEWAENIREALPAERMDVCISGSGDGERTLRFQPQGQRFADMEEKLAE